MRRRDLRKLRKYGEQACKAAVENRRDDKLKDEPVNWADLHCICARYSIDDTGFIAYDVVISEASPEATGLALFISRYLETLGYKKDIYIVTEW